MKTLACLILLTITCAFAQAQPSAPMPVIYVTNTPAADVTFKAPAQTGGLSAAAIHFSEWFKDLGIDFSAGGIEKVLLGIFLVARLARKYIPAAQQGKLGTLCEHLAVDLQGKSGTTPKT